MVTQNVVSGESNISFYLHLSSCGDQGINSLVIQLVHTVVLLSGLSNENARVPFGSLGFLILSNLGCIFLSFTGINFYEE